MIMNQEIERGIVQVKEDKTVESMNDFSVAEAKTDTEKSETAKKTRRDDHKRNNINDNDLAKERETKEIIIDCTAKSYISRLKHFKSSPSK